MKVRNKYCELTLSDAGCKSTQIQSILDGTLDVSIRYKFPEFLEKRGIDYYYLKGFGPVSWSSWEILMKSVVDLKQTFAEWCFVNNVPRSFLRYLGSRSVSYKSFSESRLYKHFVGKHLREPSKTKGLNDRKTESSHRQSDKVRLRSFERALNLASKYNVELLAGPNNWVGSHFSDGTIPLYDVKCKVCGCVYSTYFHSSTIRRCPSCHCSKFTSTRESYIQSLLESKGYLVWRNNRTILGNSLEVDIAIPKLKIAIECNGFFYHLNKSQDYHSNKTDLAFQHGWKLYHIWEDYPDHKLSNLIDRILKDSVCKVESKDVVRISRDLCPTEELFLKNNPGYKLINKEESYFVYSPRATSNHKSNTVCRDKSKYKQLLREGFERIYDAGTFVFQRVAM